MRMQVSPEMPALSVAPSAPRAIPWLAWVVLLLLVSGLVLLGNWQMQRAAAKDALQQAGQAGAGTLQGRWHDEASILIDNRTFKGRAGYHVATPLQLMDGRWVLVMRGWLAAAPDRAEPAVPAGRASAHIAGEWRAPAERFTLAGDEAVGRVWQSLDLAAYRRWSALPVMDQLFYQTGEGGDGLVRAWPALGGMAAERHRAYAWQWYGLALVLLVGGSVLLIRRGR